jgi:hypothetical protein
MFIDTVDIFSAEFVAVLVTIEFSEVRTEPVLVIPVHSVVFP